jgi:hypothetical protein
MGRRVVGIVGLAVVLVGAEVAASPLATPAGAQAPTVTFAPVTFAATGGPGPVAVTSADFNHDGTMDVATANEDHNSVSVLLNSGGTLTLNNTYPVGNQPWEIVAADFNNDGFADLAAANAASSDVSVLLNKGDGTFGAETAHVVGFTPSGIIAADVDGDGKLDLLTSNLDDNDVSVLVGDGNGGFAGAQSVGVGFEPTGLTSGDVTGDGKADVVVANFQSDTVTVLVSPFSRMFGTFSVIHDFQVGFAPSRAVLVDLDDDGSLDIAVHANAVTSNGSDTVSVLLNNGGGAFAPAVDYPAVGVRLAAGITTGDFNNDGFGDIAVSGGDSKNIGVMSGNGHGALGPASILDAGGPVEGIVAAGLTGAQGPDLVAAYHNESHIGVFANPLRPLTPPPPPPPPTTPPPTTPPPGAPRPGPPRPFKALVPTRVFDTRDSATKLGAGQVLEIPVTGRFGVPNSGVTAVALNVTVTEPDGPGFVTVYPCGTPPLASNLNFVAGQTVPNLVIAPVSANGTVCFFTMTTTHLLADISGWFEAGYTSFSPARLFDTRDGTGGVTAGKLDAGETVEIPVTGRFGIPDTGVAAVSLNVTATEADGPGFVTVYPCGSRPLASSVNFVADQTVPNAVIAPVSPTGTVCLYTLTGTHLLADVSGWFATDAYMSFSPARLFDTRDGTGGVAAAKLGAGQTLEIPVTGRFGIPDTGVAAVTLNVTVTEADGPGFLTVYPCGTRPLASNVNYETGQTVPNAVIAPVSPAGTVCLYTLTATHVLADVSGWFASA